MVAPGTAQPDVFVEFCAAGLWPGLGATLAAALTAGGITGPDDVTVQRLAALPRMTARRAERLRSSWIAAGPAYDVATLLAAGGLPVRLAGRAAAVLGNDAAAILREDPWRILDLIDVSIDAADRLARAVLVEVAGDDPRRGRAVVCRTLALAARSGHTAATVEEIGADLAAAGVPDPRAALLAAARDRGAVAGSVGQAVVFGLERYAAAEEAIALGIAGLIDAAEPIGDVGDAPEDGHEEASRAGAAGTAPRDRCGVRLDDTQRDAVAAALRHGVSVLTGGPGTGKSRTVSEVVRLARERGKEVALAAPTGRAAKRLAELTDAPTSTLHRLLGATGGPGGTEFSRGPGWPLDAGLVVVDEASMLDVELAAALIEACSEGTHLLLVGDAAQLPSIGPGQVLADIIASGTVPVTELTTLYRQAEGGAIARLAIGVRSGELTRVESPDHEVVIVPAGSSAEAAHRITQLVTDSIPRAIGIDSSAIQVVTPVHRGPAGTIELNKSLKARLNPGSGSVRGFDVGDRVVATANRLDACPTGYANGEVGVVTAADHGELTVEFSSGPATVSSKALDDLVHGWAITVHRAQGSEWPAVVVVLPPEAGRMFSRPLVYTALTRAARHLSVVHAAGPGLAHAVRRIGGTPRLTRLAELLAEASPE